MTTTPEATPSATIQTAAGHASDFETHGIDTVPRSERRYSPRHIFAVLYGSDLSLSIIVVGALPIAFGLGWWQSVGAILLGGAVGGLVLAPMGLLAPRTGTNNAVSSGASFGVAGRFIGTTLALFSALGFVAITIWTSGDALVSSVARIFGTSVNGPARAVGYAVIAVVVVGICIRGIHLLLRIQGRVMVPLMSLVMLLGLFAFGPHFDAGYGGGELLLAGFWPTFTLSALGRRIDRHLLYPARSSAIGPGTSTGAAPSSQDRASHRPRRLRRRFDPVPVGRLRGVGGPGTCLTRQASSCPTWSARPRPGTCPA